MGWNFFRTIMIWTSLMNVFLPITTLVGAQNCIYDQELSPGQIYYVYNPEYPSKYAPGTNCRWYARSPIGTQIYLSCEEVIIPASQNCYNDRLLVSLTGNTQFTDAQAFCGNGTLSLISQSNLLSIALIASYYSTGGRIMCSVTTIPSTTTTTQRPDSCDCGWKHEKRIVGGVETGINEFPYMAALYHRTRQLIFCGATIISNKYVITAAHCLTTSETSNLIILVGDHDPSTGVDTDAAAIYTIRDYKIHANFDAGTRKNDIAIVESTTKIAFSEKVGPACLPFKYSNRDFSGQYVTLLGWGQVEYSGPTSDVLQKVDVQVMALPDCRRNYTSVTIYDTEMCTYTPMKDACQFDSGGPVLWEDYDTRRLHLVGVISYGDGCAGNTASVNTRVTSYIQWIVETTQDAQYCIR
nr:venom serine protease-like [Onthophagus taurus]